MQREVVPPQVDHPQIQNLIDVAYRLYQREAQLQQAAASSKPDVTDYAYLVFPMAKAYEGFLKHYLLETGLIDRGVFQSNRFRIGRALNPDVSPHQRDEHWYYDEVVRHCGKVVGRQLWQTWLECRNHLFHFFPGRPSTITFEVAGERIQQIAATIRALQACQIPSSKIERHS